MSGYSNNSCADISKIFTCMFPDSKIAKSFELRATKLKYGINFGIALYFRDILYNHLQKSDLKILFKTIHLYLISNIFSTSFVNISHFQV